MKALTVKQLAAISGVTVRTLHHYDEIGLLKPAYVGENGYRYYERKELLRLQHILFYREFGVPLEEIVELLDMDAADQVGVLLRHREKLETEAKRYVELVATIDRTIAGIEGQSDMENADLYKGFSDEKLAEFDARLMQHVDERIDEHVRSAKDRVHETMKQALDRVRAAFAGKSEEYKAARMAELKSVEEALAKALRRGIPPTAEEVAPLIVRHKAWISRGSEKPLTEKVYRGLADFYLSHPDFVKRHEAIEPGFHDYLTMAMRAHAAREAPEEA